MNAEHEAFIVRLMDSKSCVIGEYHSAGQLALSTSHPDRGIAFLYRCSEKGTAVIRALERE